MSVTELLRPIVHSTLDLLAGVSLGREAQKGTLCDVVYEIGLGWSRMSYDFFPVSSLVV